MDEFAQSIYGNSGHNIIDGGGGHDVLVGNAGEDSFVFSTGLGSENIDRILDFLPGVDRIGLDDTVFGGLTLGTPGEAAFRVGATALDADDRIIYDPQTGTLLFDPDGSGAGAATQFASLGKNLDVTAWDFYVI